ncbi:DoxX family protein [Shimazuella sp. AN120528]|uniref:DoxX family protein n=1 Tax=Shimazuella soli TaxID=1892854 RepID=UPI001F0E3EDB|nr:DoxX family protein [Shimazuella soli]MCH5584490.1 DoxX family protein [Shimazuella soli]
MAPLIALFASFVIFRLIGFAGVAYFNEWHTSLQAGVALMFLLTASAHWGKRREDLIRMVPSSFPNPDLLVTITGWLEIIGAIGILIPQTSVYASLGLAIMLVAMFPANIKAAREGLTIAGQPTPKIVIRTILQIIFLVAVLLAG